MHNFAFEEKSFKSACGLTALGTYKQLCIGKQAKTSVNKTNFDRDILFSTCNICVLNDFDKYAMLQGTDPEVEAVDKGWCYCENEEQIETSL